MPSDRHYAPKLGERPSGQPGRLDRSATKTLKRLSALMRSRGASTVQNHRNVAAAPIADDDVRLAVVVQVRDGDGAALPTVIGESPTERNPERLP